MSLPGLQLWLLRCGRPACVLQTYRSWKANWAVETAATEAWEDGPVAATLSHFEESLGGLQVRAVNPPPNKRISQRKRPCVMAPGPGRISSLRSWMANRGRDSGSCPSVLQLWSQMGRSASFLRLMGAMVMRLSLCAWCVAPRSFPQCIPPRVELFPRRKIPWMTFERLALEGR